MSKLHPTSEKRKELSEECGTCSICAVPEIIDMCREESEIKRKLGVWAVIQPTSLFNNDQFMREAHKSKLGQHLKDKVVF